MYKTVHGKSSVLFVSHSKLGHFIALIRGSVGSKCVYSFTKFDNRFSVCLKNVLDTHTLVSEFCSSLPQFLHLLISILEVTSFSSSETTGASAIVI
jgi:hypothetical protein